MRIIEVEMQEAGWRGIGSSWSRRGHGELGTIKRKELNREVCRYG
jgi:hypothetical protein